MNTHHQATLFMALGPYLWFLAINKILHGPQIKVRITVSLGWYPEIFVIRADSSSESYDHIIQYIYFIYFFVIAMPPRRKAKKSPAFNKMYAQKYSLRISSQYPSTKKVVLVEFCFCVAFGRECKVGEKRKVTNNIHLFTSFWEVQMKAHMEGQHAEKWREYDRSSLEEKESFFKYIYPFKSTINSHFGGS